MRKILTLEYPPVTSYPSIANILSMVWPIKDKAIVWFCDHFIQLVFRPKHKYSFLDFYDHADLDNYFSIIYGMPGIGWMRHNSETANFEKFTDYIEHQIDQSYGLEACLDRYYLESLGNKPKHFIHSSFIYGYDNEEKEVYVFDFWETGKYSSKVFNYDEINRSMNNNGIINLFKVCDFDYELNMELMKKSLNDYLHSVDSMYRFQSSNKDYNKNVIFGLDCYQYLFFQFKEYGSVDTRMYHVMLDHKVMMKYRLECLLKVEVLSIEDYNILKEINDVLISKTSILRSLAIMLNTHNSMIDVSKLEMKICELRDLDENFVVRFLECIKYIW